MASVAPGKRNFANPSFVTLIVGAYETAFPIQEDILFKASPVFKAAFSSNFKEGSQKTMTLPDDNACLFNYLIECIYTQTADYKIFCSENMVGYNMQDCLMQCAQLFVLADKYDVEVVKQSLYRSFYQLAKSQYGADHPILPSQELITYLYANTHRESFIRKVITDWFAWVSHRQKSKGYWFQGRGTPKFDWLYDIPDFGVDLALILGTQDTYHGVASPYSEHEEANYFEKISPED